MSKQFRRRLLSVLVLILISLACLEGVLRFADPIGVYRYIADFTALSALSLPAPDGIRYTPGIHHFSMYGATIGLDGLRVVPGNPASACRIAFVGDSVTFGMGSDVSFVDLLAPDLEATVVNAGLPGYSALNVRAELDAIPADGYIWLMIQNDDEPRLMWHGGAGLVPSALSLYLWWLFPDAVGPVKADTFREALAPLLARKDLLIFAFKNARLTDIAVQQSESVHVIPPYTHHVSRFDAHPDTAGAREIADSMRDAVKAFTGQQCAKGHA